MLTLFTDPGHGWLAVPKTVIINLGLLEKISHYSHERGGIVYCEEDCDAPRVIAALEACNGCSEPVKYSHTNRNSPIRNYPAYRP